jgi:hypothetical protein
MESVEGGMLYEVSEQKHKRVVSAWTVTSDEIKVLPSETSEAHSRQSAGWLSLSWAISKTKRNHREAAGGRGSAAIPHPPHAAAAPTSSASALSKSRYNQRWSPEENKLLEEGVQLYNNDWNLVAAHIKTRTANQAMSHYATQKRGASSSSSSSCALPDSATAQRPFSSAASVFAAATCPRVVLEQSPPPVQAVEFNEFLQRMKSTATVVAHDDSKVDDMIIDGEMKNANSMLAAARKCLDFDQQQVRSMLRSGVVSRILKAQLPLKVALVKASVEAPAPATPEAEIKASPVATAVDTVESVLPLAPPAPIVHAITAVGVEGAKAASLEAWCDKFR